MDVLFITDECESKKEYSITRRDGEGINYSSKKELEMILTKIFDSVISTYSLEEACFHIANNKKLFVVTTFYGTASADSKSIIPALCKANHVHYLGADAYTHMICNDKYLSKKYIEHFGLNRIPGCIIYAPNCDIEYSQLDSLKYPVIIKPNFGGGSNGIICNSVKNNKIDAIKYIKELFEYQKMPILVEEYIPGYEVSVAIMGNKSKIFFCEETSLSINKKNYFDTEVFGLESKKIDVSQRVFLDSNFIDDNTKLRIKQVFNSFEKVDFMRFDFRVNNNIPYLMEISPDCNICSNGLFFAAAKRSGLTFEEMIKKLIETSMNNQNY